MLSIAPGSYFVLGQSELFVGEGQAHEAGI